MKTKKPHEPAASRAAAGQTQADAAALIGVSCRTWQSWEGGINPMPSAMLRLYRHLVGLERIPYNKRES